jgi:isoleucyl-tRNA synthetase
LSDGTTIELRLEHLEVITEGIEGWLVASGGGVTVALDTTLTDALLAEGLAREFVSHVQKMRKELRFEVTDRITIFARSSATLEGALQLCEAYVRQETLATTIHFADHDQALEIDVNSEHCKVALVKDPN